MKYFLCFCLFLFCVSYVISVLVVLRFATATFSLCFPSFLTLSFLSLYVGRLSWLNLCWSIPRAQRALCGMACLWQPGSSSWN